MNNTIIFIILILNLNEFKSPYMFTQITPAPCTVAQIIEAYIHNMYNLNIYMATYSIYHVYCLTEPERSSNQILLRNC